MNGEIVDSVCACRKRYTSIRVSIERDSIDNESDKAKGQPRNGAELSVFMVSLLIDGRCRRSSFEEGILGKIAIDK